MCFLLYLVNDNIVSKRNFCYSNNNDLYHSLTNPNARNIFFYSFAQKLCVEELSFSAMIKPVLTDATDVTDLHSALTAPMNLTAVSETRKGHSNLQTTVLNGTAKMMKAK